MAEGKKHRKIKRKISKKFNGQTEESIKIDDKYYILDVFVMNAGKELPVEVGNVNSSKCEDLIDKFGQVLRVTKEGEMYLETKDEKRSFSSDQYYETKKVANPLQDLKEMVPAFEPDTSFECPECMKEMEYVGIYRTPKYKINTSRGIELKMFRESGKSTRHFTFECQDCFLRVYYNPEEEKGFVDRTKRRRQRQMMEGAKRRFGK